MKNNEEKKTLQGHFQNSSAILCITLFLFL